MTTVIGVRFRTAGKIYYFSPKDTQFKKGDHVIVETARGVEYGMIKTHSPVSLFRYVCIDAKHLNFTAATR